MLSAKLLHLTVALINIAFLHEAQGKLMIFPAVGTSQSFITISKTQDQTNSLIAAASNKEPPVISHEIIDSKNNDNKQRPISLREMAENVKTQIEKYKELRNIAQKQGSKNRYDELLKDAHDLAKEIEDASHKYDELRSEQAQKGSTDSGAQADRLTEIIQNKTEPFNSLLWRMDQVIAEIKQDDTTMPGNTAYGSAHERIPPTPKLATSRTKREEPLIHKSTPCEDEEEENQEKIKLSPLQSFNGKNEDLEMIGN